MGGAAGAHKSRPDIEAAVAAAEVHPLLCAVAQRTGDLSLLRTDFAPDQTQLLTPERGLSPEQADEARRLATDALLAHIEAGAPEHTLTRDELQRAYGFLIGADSTGQWEGFLTEELALEGTDPRAPSWHLDELAGGRSFRCAVIGAGASGLAAAHRLRQTGVAVTVFEKNDDVGGTWLENVYPGCRVDVPNQLYSFSFAQTNDWASRFSAQPDLLAYLQGLAKELGLGASIRFRSEVTEARHDDETHRWTLTVRNGANGANATNGDGTETAEEFDAVVCAVGQLNRPSFAAIAGRDTFAGESFHSAAWDDTIELANRRVAVIGTGASAAQFVPLIAADTAHLDLFQRTPPWLLPTDNYGDPFPPAFHDLLTILPNYGRWDRLWQFWIMHEGLLVAARVDPEWDEHTKAVSAGNDFVRSMLLDVLRAQVTDDELYEKMVPHFPPFAKRALRDDGRWAAACSRPEVDLVTTPIAEITPTGVRTTDGEEHPADVLVYGTGFTASDFVAPMRVFGLGGKELNEEWDGDATAYLGITVPGFPNFFMLYGPNTNLVINGSILIMVECQVRYAVESIGRLLREGHRSMSCRRDVHERYGREMEEGNAKMVWGVADVPTWYRNKHGRVTQNWPFDLHTYWSRTLEPDLGDYELA